MGFHSTDFSMAKNQYLTPLIVLFLMVCICGAVVGGIMSSLRFSWYTRCEDGGMMHSSPGTWSAEKR